MSNFNPEKLHVQFDQAIKSQDADFPRCYTLTHSDVTGELFLTIGTAYDHEALSGIYNKFMHDEVLGEWQTGQQPFLLIHCHVSGGLVLGPAKWRESIFRQHLPMVLAAICYGDQAFLLENPSLLDADITVHFHAKQDSLDREENWGKVRDYSKIVNDDTEIKETEST